MLRFILAWEWWRDHLRREFRLRFRRVTASRI